MADPPAALVEPVAEAAATLEVAQARAHQAADPAATIRPVA